MEMVTFEPWVRNIAENINHKIDSVELRDLFAMFAMNGIVSDPNRIQTSSFLEIAEISYDVADEMLKARRSK